MYLETANAILSQNKNLMEWNQKFLFKTSDGVVDLAVAVGDHAHTPVNATCQPAQYPTFRYSKHKTFYRFDPNTYFGLPSHEKLMQDVRSSLKGARFLTTVCRHEEPVLFKNLRAPFTKYLPQKLNTKTRHL